MHITEFIILLLWYVFLLFIEIDSCHDNCGKITNGMDCSCD